jgi:hypothetical protein
MLGAALAIGAVGLLGPVGASHGAAETGTFPIDGTFIDQVDDTGSCLGAGATGTITGTETGSGRYTENGPPAFGFHDHFTVRSDFRIEYQDGRFIVGSEVAHVAENATHRDQFVSTTTLRDSGTLYSANGEPLGPIVIRGTLHVTYRDTNGNHVPDAGEVTALVDDFRVTCP